MADNHTQAKFVRSNDPEERITRLCAAGLEAIKASPEYLADDKLSVLITNDVVKSDWGQSECGMGFWNYDNPHDLITTLLNHIQAVGEGYGCGIGVVEMQIMEARPDPKDILSQAIMMAMQRMREEADNAESN